MAITVNPKHFRKLKSTRMKIVEIYPEYRYGWSDAANKFREFNYFPDTATAQTVYSGDEGTKSNDPTVRFHLREKLWDDTASKFKFEKMGKLDGQFFKNYSKVFDVDVKIESDVKIPTWNRETKTEMEVNTPAGSIVRLKAVSSKKIQDIAKSMMLSKGIAMVKFQRKNRLT